MRSKGTYFRYICDNGTCIARYDDLYGGRENQTDVSEVDVSMDEIELADREFFNAIAEGREPKASEKKQKKRCSNCHKAG
jgi:2-hydroxy-4-carboxymuconate semialdehyde hemiacetal dehydrogenase